MNSIKKKRRKFWREKKQNRGLFQEGCVLLDRHWTGPGFLSSHWMGPGFLDSHWTGPGLLDSHWTCPNSDFWSNFTSFESTNDFLM